MCRRQSASCRPRSASTDSPARVTSLPSSTRRPTPRSSRSTCSHRPSTGPGPVVGAATRRAPSMRSRRRERLSGTPAVGAAACALMQAPDDRPAAELANTFAPEHLELIGPAAEALSPLIQSAGGLFVGAQSATAFGDYVAGSNHVLPTGGAARFALGPLDAPFQAPHGGGAHRRGRGRAARPGRRPGGAERGLRAPRALDASARARGPGRTADRRSTSSKSAHSGLS